MGIDFGSPAMTVVLLAVFVFLCFVSSRMNKRRKSKETKKTDTP